MTDLAPQIANVSLNDNHDGYSATKDVVSINPLDVARSSTDEEDVPIWMRKSKTERRNRNNKRDRNRVSEYNNVFFQFQSLWFLVLFFHQWAT